MPKPPPYHVLIEATKLMEADGDGVKRYLVELLKTFHQLPPAEKSNWQFDLYIYGDIVSLEDYEQYLKIEIAQRNYGLLWYEKPLLALKAFLQKILPESVYEALAPIYRHSPIRWAMQRTKKGIKAVKRWIKPLKNDPRFAKYDLIHLPLPQHEDPFDGLDCQFIATVHDLTHKRYPEFHQKRNIRLANKGFRFMEKQDAHYIAVSKSTKRDLMEEMKIPEERIHVVYEAADRNHFKPNNSVLAAKQVRQKYRIGTTPFLLCLSTIEPRKNLLRTIEAFQQMKQAHPDLDVNLVIAGKYGWKNKEVYKSVDLDAEDILFTGFVAESDLPVLYSEALALCYVSIYEGFGLPALEAMQCGTPVIYGNNSSLPEVVGEGGLPAEAMNVDNIAKQMKILVQNEELRSQLAQRAMQQAADFSWLETGRETLETYKLALELNKNL